MRINTPCVLGITALATSFCSPSLYMRTFLFIFKTTACFAVRWKFCSAHWSGLLSLLSKNMRSNLVWWFTFHHYQLVDTSVDLMKPAWRPALANKNQLAQVNWKQLTFCYQYWQFKGSGWSLDGKMGINGHIITTGIVIMNAGPQTALGHSWSKSDPGSNPI